MKHTCNDYEDTKGVIIKDCESHEERVDRKNKFILTQLELLKDIIITGHGLIKPKTKYKGLDDTGMMILVTMRKMVMRKTRLHHTR